MFDKSLADLINRKIDGSLTAEEEVRLAERLATNEEARLLLDDLSRQGLLFQKMGVVEPPPSLKPSIMRAIQHSTSTARRGWIPDAASRLFESRKRMRYAFALTGGVVAGILILAVGFGVLRPGALVESDVAGTSVIESASPAFRSLEEREISSGQVQGRISTASVGGGHHIIIRLQGPEDTRVQLLLQPETVRVAGVERLDGTPADYTTRPGGVELRGPIAYRLLLQGAASVRVTVSAAGQQGYDGEFRLDR